MNEMFHNYALHGLGMSQLKHSVEMEYVLVFLVLWIFLTLHQDLMNDWEIP